MNQNQLDREVSRATGESVKTIRRHGFSVLPLPSYPHDEEPDAGYIRIVDWDAQDAIRRRAA